MKNSKILLSMKHAYMHGLIHNAQTQDPHVGEQAFLELKELAEDRHRDGAYIHPGEREALVKLVLEITPLYAKETGG